jgi:hypothetical protein
MQFYCSSGENKKKLPVVANIGAIFIWNTGILYTSQKKLPEISFDVKHLF